MKRQVYLSMKPLEEAKELFFSQFRPDQRTGVETIKTEDALGRITAEPVLAARSTPSPSSTPTSAPMDRSPMW